MKPTRERRHMRRSSVELKKNPPALNIFQERIDAPVATHPICYQRLKVIFVFFLFFIRHRILRSLDSF